MKALFEAGSTAIGLALAAAEDSRPERHQRFSSALLDSLHRLHHQLVHARAAFGDVLDNLLPTCGETRPYGLPSSIAAGSRFPRQYTGSTVKLPSAVVSPSLTSRRFSTCATSLSHPITWHASARQMRSTWRPGGVCAENRDK